jgi:hypothetical protein
MKRLFAALLAVIVVFLGFLIWRNWDRISDVLSHWYLYYQD